MTCGRRRFILCQAKDFALNARKARFTTEVPMPARNPRPRKGSTPLSDALKEWERRQQSYREQALKILPWVCAWCGREFSARNVRELTVHHKDHNHDNNPPDGSNWELLCMYCHEHVHLRKKPEDFSQKPLSHREEPGTYRPFAQLESLLKEKENRSGESPDGAE